MKKAKNLLCYLLSTIIPICTFFSNSVSYVRATTTESSEQKIQSTATMDDDFADNRIFVVFNKETSLEFNEYTVTDFSELNCKDVKNLTQSIGEKNSERVICIRKKIF